MGVAPNVPTWFWTNPGSDFWGDLVGWVNSMSTNRRVPLVHMISYADQGDGPSQEYRDRLSLEFAELGGRGITVVVSAGDLGTGCSLCYYFQPSFPATSPFVTTVGATSFQQKRIGPEVGSLTFSSGGGFAWNFEQPAYQAAVVSHYFANSRSLPRSHFYNAYGRGFPDLSAIGSGFQIIEGGMHSQVDGTAGATATVAAMISLLNEIRIDHNRAPLGFINPVIYMVAEKYPDAFFDVVEGNNHYGCCGYSGFHASSGWDPVSGLGTPNYWILKTVVGHLEHALR